MILANAMKKIDRKNAYVFQKYVYKTEEGKAMRASRYARMPRVSLAIRFVGQLADQQFIRLGNFHIPEILDIPAFLWLLAHA